MNQAPQADQKGIDQSQAQPMPPGASKPGDTTGSENNPEHFGK
jgi:hypothetical protein